MKCTKEQPRMIQKESANCSLWVLNVKLPSLKLAIFSERWWIFTSEEKRIRMRQPQEPERTWEMLTTSEILAARLYYIHHNGMLYWWWCYGHHDFIFTGSLFLEPQPQAVSRVDLPLILCWDSLPTGCAGVPMFLTEGTGQPALSLCYLLACPTTHCHGELQNFVFWLQENTWSQKTPLLYWHLEESQVSIQQNYPPLS